jgi:hypothetical protein
MSDNRQLAHELIDLLPEAQISGLVRFLETIIDPVAGALANAPIEDEEISDQEENAVAEARESLKRNNGRSVPHSEAMRRLELD